MVHPADIGGLVSTTRNKEKGLATLPHMHLFNYEYPLSLARPMCQSQSLSRTQWHIGRRLSSVFIALGHAAANAVKATAGSRSTGSSASLTFPLHSHMSSARRAGSEYHF